MKPLRACIAVLGLAATLGAFAQAEWDKEIGSPVEVSDNLRTIVIKPDTRYVNVNPGESVRFVAGDAVFAWRFDGKSTRVFDLKEVAPSGALANPVKVYVKARVEHNR